MSQRKLEIKSPQGVRQIPFGAHPVTVGRHNDNIIVLVDSMASRRHCVIELSAGGPAVRDLDSSNGTLVNGQKIEQPMTLFDDDVIRIGQCTIRLIDPSRPRQQAAPTEQYEELSEEDAIEELSEEDLADDEIVNDGHAMGTESDSIEIGSDDAPIHVAAEVGDFERVLQELIDAMPEPRVGESEIALVNARGQVVHPAGKSRRASGKIDAVETLRMIMLICLRSRATDIHLEPKHEQYQVRIRVDGVMVEVARIDPQMGVRISALVKVLSDIDISQRNVIQEGHFAANAPTIVNGRIKPPHRIDYRVSFAPAMHGQKLVIRVLDTTNAPLRISDLQLPTWMYETLAKAIQQESGMVLVCGPTGSGKTTSLYALVRSIEVSQLNVMTIEDPIEVELEGVTQIPVDEPAGKSFSALLRSLLRQDPDVILVGEVRDPETARIAMQAAITGHMVFSTLHTKDSIGTIFRLLDLGVEPYLIAQGLHVVLAQRLVRQLCPHCKQTETPTPEQAQKLAATVGKVNKVFVPRGCPRCLNTGFSGRRAFFELLSATDELRDVILKSPTLEQIQKTLAGTPFKRLEHNGHLLVAEGLVPFDEIDRASVR